MYCTHCGSPLNDNSNFCTNCGAPVQRQAPTAYQPQAANFPVSDAAPRTITFSDAISLFFQKYATFSGRATRSEYWYVVLFNIAMSMLFGLISSFTPDFGGLLSGLFSLGTLIPGCALFTRRMHDIGKSGWNWLWSLVPLAGLIVLLVFLCRASGEDNQYGPRTV